MYGVILKINNFEKQLFNAMQKSRKQYVRLATYWLWHAPESFFQVATALNISSKTGNEIYLEVTPSTIREEVSPARGRPKAGKNRFDMVVWKKGSGLKAIIEFKTQNVNKMRRYTPGKKFGRYLCFYVERKTNFDFIEKLNDISTKLDLRIVDKIVRSQRDEAYSWCMAIFRI
jgi:hypothetical protein